MPKSIKSRERPATDVAELELEAPALSEVERFAAESRAIVYEGPDDGIMVDGKTLKHGAVVRVWPHDAEAKCSGELFRAATGDEAAANKAVCCPGCASGGKCLAPKLGEEG